jgi:cellulose synthase/poly-beta-1,6-N-acetylglucosamine synthase-like glycosyltransferase
VVSAIKDSSAQAAAKHPFLELSVVIPTYKERQNVAPRVASLESALQGLNCEVIFVDDLSPDHTADTIRELALTNPRVRILERIERRGLSSACIEGMMASPALEGAWASLPRSAFAGATLALESATTRTERSGKTRAEGPSL